jgi:hypothetical protein
LLHLEQRVYQRLFLLCAAIRSERLPCVLCEKGDNQPPQPLSDHPVLLCHGFIWGYDLVTEDAENDLRV